jgi:hypothetical protein
MATEGETPIHPQEEAPTKKRKQSPVDMRTIPSCMAEEGYLDEKEEKPVPNYLKCPICRDLLVSPVMFSCGHTLCEQCNPGKSKPSWEDTPESHQCPVCRLKSSVAPITNFILDELLREQFAEEQVKRREEVERMKVIKKKLERYGSSSRLKDMVAELDKCFTDSKHCTLDVVEKHFGSLDWECPATLDEIKFVISQQVKYNYTTIGKYVVKREQTGAYVQWLENHDTEENQRWSSLMLARPFEPPPMPRIFLPPGAPPPGMVPPPIMGRGRGRGMPPPGMMGVPPPGMPSFTSGSTHVTYKKLAAMRGIEIGEELDLERWGNAPAYWIRDLNLEDKSPVVEETLSTLNPRSRWDE